MQSVYNNARCFCEGWWFLWTISLRDFNRGREQGISVGQKKVYSYHKSAACFSNYISSHNFYVMSLDVFSLCDSTPRSKRLPPSCWVGLGAHLKLPLSWEVGRTSTSSCSHRVIGKHKHLTTETIPEGSCLIPVWEAKRDQKRPLHMDMSVLL